MPTRNRRRRATLSAIITFALFAAALAVAPAATAQEAPEVCTEDVPAYEWHELLEEETTETEWLFWAQSPSGDGWSQTGDTFGVFPALWIEWERVVAAEYGPPQLFAVDDPPGGAWELTTDPATVGTVTVEVPCPEQPDAVIETTTETEIDCDVGESTTTTTTTTTEYVWNPDTQDWELGDPVDDVQVETESYEGEECPPEPEVVVETSYGPVDCEANTQVVTTTTTTTEYVWNPDTQEWELGDDDVVEVDTETVPVVGAPECLDPCLDNPQLCGPPDLCELDPLLCGPPDPCDLDPQLCGPPDLCELNPNLEQCQDEGQDDEGSEDDGQQDEDSEGDESDEQSPSSTITVPRDPDAPADEVITSTTTTTEADEDDPAVLGTEVEADAVEAKASSGVASDGATLPRTGVSTLSMLLMGLGFLSGGFSLTQFARRSD